MKTVALWGFLLLSFCGGSPSWGPAFFVSLLKAHTDRDSIGNRSSSTHVRETRTRGTRPGEKALWRREADGRGLLPTRIRFNAFPNRVESSLFGVVCFGVGYPHRLAVQEGKRVLHALAVKLGPGFLDAVA